TVAAHVQQRFQRGIRRRCVHYLDHGNRLEQQVDCPARIYSGGLGLETEDQTMAQYVVDYRLDILATDEVPAGEPGVGPGAAIQGDGAPGAGAHLDPFRQLRVVQLGATGRHDQLDQVLLHRVSHEQPEDLLTCGQDALLGDALGNARLETLGLAPGQMQDL